MNLSSEVADHVRITVAKALPEGTKFIVIIADGNIGAHFISNGVSHYQSMALFAAFIKSDVEPKPLPEP